MLERRQKIGWIFVSPFIIGQLLFTIVPLICSVYFAFTDYDMFSAPEWIGLDNFKYWLFEARTMWKALRNSLVFAFLHVPLEIGISCILAALLNTKIKCIGVFRTIFYIPVLTPLLAVTLIWMLMYNPSSGFLNNILGAVGLGPFKFVYSVNELEVVASVVAMTVWKGVGYSSIYLFTAMQSISEDVIEAAEIDGAIGVKRFFRITLPLISPIIFYLFIIGISGAVQVFDQFYLMGDSNNVNVLGTLIYKSAWTSFDMGRAAALSWFSFIIVLSLTLIQKSAEKRWVYYE